MDKVIRYLPVTYVLNDEGELVSWEVDSPLNINNVININGKPVDDLGVDVEQELGDRDDATISQKVITEYINSALYVGKIELHSLDVDNLPNGWIHADGTKYVIESDVAQALIGLGEPYLTNWGVVVTNKYVQVPNLVKATGGVVFMSAGSAYALGSITEKPSTTSELLMLDEDEAQEPYTVYLYDIKNKRFYQQSSTELIPSGVNIVTEEEYIAGTTPEAQTLSTVVEKPKRTRKKKGE